MSNENKRVKGPSAQPRKRDRALQAVITGIGAIRNAAGKIAAARAARKSDVDMVTLIIRASYHAHSGLCAGSFTIGGVHQEFEMRVQSKALDPSMSDSLLAPQYEVLLVSGTERKALYDPLSMHRLVFRRMFTSGGNILKRVTERLQLSEEDKRVLHAESIHVS